MQAKAQFRYQATSGSEVTADLSVEMFA